MFKGLLKLAVIFAGIGFLIRYLIHKPLPSGVPEKDHVQFVCDVIGFVELLGSVSELVGHQNRWWGYQASPRRNAGISTDGFNVFEKELAGVKSIIVQPQELSQKPSPALIWFCGGGFITGSAENSLGTLILAANETGYTVVSPNYRKAPQYPFPIPFEDALNSTIDFITRANEFNVDPSKIAIGGTSAGGNLAMSVMLELAKRGDPKQTPSMLYLMEGFIQMANFRLPSYQLYQICTLPKPLLSKFFLAYIGLNHRLDLTEIIQLNRHIRPEIKKKLDEIISCDALPKEYQLSDFNSSALPLNEGQAALLDEEVLNQIEEAVLDPRISPLSASDEELSTLPRTHILTGEYDPLRDESIILHQRLKKLGKDVSLQVLTKTIHGSSTFGLLWPQNNYYVLQTKLMYQTIKQYFDAL